MQLPYLRKYIFQISFLLFIGVFIFLHFFNLVETEDVWWHLSTGKWIIQHLQVPHVDIFPFANEKTPWICNHWLGSVILYLVVKAGGLLGLKIFRSLFFVFITSILFFYSYRRMPFSFLVILVLLMTFGLSERAFLRPDIFNFFFIQIFLINLFDYEDSGNRNRLWILPIATLIWSNIHLGSFIYGIPLLSIFFLSACIRYFNLNPGQNNDDEVKNVKRQVKDLALTILACLSSFVINPYGVEGFLYPFKVILFPDYIGLYTFIHFKQEAHPPGYIFTSFGYFFFFVLFALGMLILFLNKKNNFTLIILLLFSFFAFLYVSRNSAFFTLVCVYVIAEGAKRTRFNDVWQSLRYSNIVDCLLLTGVTFFLLIQISQFWNQKSYYNGRLVNDRSFKINPVSEAPIKLLIKDKITGPVFNQDVLGGQMIWFGYPSLRPFQDSRNVSLERFNNFMAILLNPKEVWPKAQRDYNFKIVILNTANDLQLPFIKYLNTQPAWQLISVNGPLVTYVKRGEFYLPKELNEFEVLLKSHDLSIDDLRNLKRLAERKNVLSLQRIFYPSIDDVDLFSNALTLFRLGYKGAAAEDLVKALKISDQPDMQHTARLILKQLVKGGEV